MQKKKTITKKDIQNELLRKENEKLLKNKRQLQNLSKKMALKLKESVNSENEGED